MVPDNAHLAALVAIVDEGSFEAAARKLHVTPSAVSQRIRALEASVGHVVVVRATPCVATRAGEAFVRLGRQLELLVADAAREVGEAGAAQLRIAVNADSLATWFKPIVAKSAELSGTALRLYVEDQAWTHELLRSGEVLGAVTSSAQAVQGCLVEPLGALRYVPVGTPKIAALEWAERPMVTFNEKDALQHDFLAQRGLVTPDVIHRIPTSEAYADAIHLGLGWGLLPEGQCRAGLEGGELVQLEPVGVDVPLWWQCWRLQSPTVSLMTDWVRQAAVLGLRATVHTQSAGRP